MASPIFSTSSPHSPPHGRHSIRLFFFLSFFFSCEYNITAKLDYYVITIQLAVVAKCGRQTGRKRTGEHGDVFYFRSPSGEDEGRVRTTCYLTRQVLNLGTFIDAWRYVILEGYLYPILKHPPRLLSLLLGSRYHTTDPSDVFSPIARFVYNRLGFQNGSTQIRTSIGSDGCPQRDMDNLLLLVEMLLLDITR